MINAFLSMTRGQYKKNSRWRATLRVAGEQNRLFGTKYEDPVLTARNLLMRIAFRIPNVEKDRVVEIVKDLYGTRSHGSQPSKSPCVKIIHQIYGVFRDGRAMPNLFANSQMRWRQVAKQMGATYHIWSADEVDALMKKHYAQLWDTYKDVPFAVMRVDIARVAILHQYGGMYVDLDVLPNTDIFLQAPLAVQKSYNSGYHTARATLRSAERKHAVYDKTSNIDIEVLIASRANPVLMRWLFFIQKQIEERDYKSHPEVWSRRPIRYIFSTTGPQCFQRFLHMPDNKEVRRTMQYISSNNFSHGEGLCVKEQRNFDVLSFESNSYYSQKKAPFKIPVGDGEGPLPVLDGSQPRTVLRRRIASKRRLLQQDVVCLSQPRTQVNAPVWRQNTLSSAITSDAASSQATPPPTKKIAVDQESQTNREHLRDAQTQTEKDIQSDYFRCSVTQLRKHVKWTGRCIGTKTFLEDCPEEIKLFLSA